MDDIEVIGSIYLFAGTFAPYNWEFCDGRLMYIPEHPALYSILGATYGGDGISTFALPDLRARVPIGAGKGANLHDRRLGEKGGADSVILTIDQMPPHTHAVRGVAQAAIRASPINNLWARETNNATMMYADREPNTQMSVTTIGPSGGNQPHENRQPYLVLQYIICVTGLYPIRS